MSDIFAKLAAPFPPDRISWRVGSTNGDKTKGMALAYIDARDVMGRLDDACGPAGWACRYPHANGKTVCEVGLKVNDEWIWKADGAGDTDYEAEKGALSDAFKRAAVRWGVGRYLYDISSPWVAVEQRGKTYIIKSEEHGKLRKVLETHKANAPLPPVPVTPSGRKSSAQAKRDGDDAKIKADIAKADKDGLRDWHENFDSYTAPLPVSWLDSVRDMLEERLSELNAAEAGSDLDDGFRNAVGPGVSGAGALAGNASHMAAE